MDRFEIRASVVVALLVLTFVGVLSARRYRLSLIREVHWSEVPYQLGPWHGEEAPLDPLYGNPADTSLTRIYADPGGAALNIYVGFHKTLPDGLDDHTPVLCYPSQGWTVLRQGKLLLDQAGGQPFMASDAVVYKGGAREFVVWWYEAGSKFFDARIRHVYGLMARAMFTGRTDGVMVEIETPLPAAGGTRETEYEISQFCKFLLPALNKALPQ